MKNDLITVFIKEPNKEFNVKALPFKRLTSEFRKLLKSTAFFQYGVPYANLVAYFARKDERNAQFNVKFFGQPIYGTIIFTGCSVDGGEIRNVNAEDVKTINTLITAACVS